MGKTSRLKSFLTKEFAGFLFFKSYLGYRIFLSLVLSILVGVLDGFGLAMFLPMLEAVNGEMSASSEKLGNLSFLVDLMETLGMSLTLNTVLGMMLFFFALKGIAKYAESLYRVVIQHHFLKNLRVSLITALGKYQYNEFVNSDSGRIFNTLSGEMTNVNQAYFRYFNALSALVMLVVYIFLAYLSNPQFALMVSVGGFLSNFLFKAIFKKTKAESARITLDKHDYLGLLSQMVNFFKYLKATGRMNQYTDKLKQSAEDIEQSNKQMGIYTSIVKAIREPVIVMIVVVVIFVEVNYLGQDLGLIILSLLFFYRSLGFVLTLQNHWNQFLVVSGSLNNITEFQNTLEKGAEVPGERELIDFRTGIHAKDLKFAYGNTTVLNGVTLDIKKDQTIAFVGESGSGKTTLINLISGLMTVENDSLLIDGIPSSKIDFESFQKRIGYITQEPVIFNDTIFNNVAFWDEKSEANLERFWKSLEKASISDFVRGQTHSEDEELGTNGVNLSGGQRQRISIARELYRDIDILIMDEATSALDTETERLIQQNIDALKGKYTILMISHRLSTVKSADQVILLDKGQIIDSGTYESLLKSSKQFEKMVTLQEL